MLRKNKRKKILIVEQDETLAKMLVDTLNPNFITLLTKNHKEVFDLIQKEYPDVLLIDIDNIEDDEIALIQKIKNDKIGENIFIVVLANNSSSDKIVGLIKSGVSDYFIKSDLTIQDVYEKIYEKCLNK
jgi:DNA-binding NtrC family response regulator